jgi:hypothetical protein
MKQDGPRTAHRQVDKLLLSLLILILVVHSSLSSGTARTRKAQLGPRGLQQARHGGKEMAHEKESASPLSIGRAARHGLLC